MRSPAGFDLAGGVSDSVDEGRSSMRCRIYNTAFVGSMGGWFMAAGRLAYCADSVGGKASRALCSQIGARRDVWAGSCSLAPARHRREIVITIEYTIAIPYTSIGITLYKHE